MKILKNIKIVELAMYLPLPYTSAFFSKIGAEVIKIELPKKGDPLKTIDNSVYKVLNEGKNIIYLDLNKSEDIEKLKKIIYQSDVVLNGFRRGFLDKKGLGFKDISKKKKNIIYINLYGYPKEITLRDKAGHDINFLGLCGIFDLLTGFNKPLPIQVADMAGALWSIIACLIMMERRKKIRKGGELDLSLFSSLISFLPFFYFSSSDGEINKGLLYGQNPFYNLYECKDGKFIAVGSLEEKFARRFLEILNLKYDENIFSDEKKKSDLNKKLKKIFKSREQNYFNKLFEKEDICVTPVYSKEDFFNYLLNFFTEREKLQDFILFPIK